MLLQLNFTHYLIFLFPSLPQGQFQDLVSFLRLAPCVDTYSPCLGSSPLSWAVLPSWMCSLLHPGCDTAYHSPYLSRMASLICQSASMPGHPLIQNLYSLCLGSEILCQAIPKQDSLLIHPGPSFLEDSQCWAALQSHP